MWHRYGHLPHEWMWWDTAVLCVPPLPNGRWRDPVDTDTNGCQQRTKAYNALWLLEWLQCKKTPVALTQLNEDRWQTRHRAISLDPTRASMETCCLSLGGITAACLCPSMLLKHVQTCQIDMNEKALWGVQGRHRGICTFCACFAQTILSENEVSFRCHVVVCKKKTYLLLKEPCRYVHSPCLSKVIDCLSKYDRCRKERKQGMSVKLIKLLTLRGPPDV